MTTQQQWFTADEAAALSNIDITVVWYFAELGLISPSDRGYTEHNLAELRRVRRLREDLELKDPAIEVILRMHRRIQMLQAEIRRFETMTAMRQPIHRYSDELEAVWDNMDRDQL